MAKAGAESNTREVRQRKQRRVFEDTRTRIKLTMIINKLHDHIEGKIDMSATQMRAAEILLRKTLPDLQSVSLTDGDGQPTAFRIYWGDPPAEKPPIEGEAEVVTE